jgi:hypothetical protein
MWLCSGDIVKVCYIDPYMKQNTIHVAELEQQQNLQTSGQALVARSGQNGSSTRVYTFLSHQLLSIVLGFVVWWLGIHQAQVDNATALRAARARATAQGCIAAQIVRTIAA